MDSSELLRIRLANRLVCASQQIAIGPTGPTGAAGSGGGGGGVTGSTGPTGPENAGGVKSYTIFIDFASGGTISSVYIPPGLFSPSAVGGLSAGGTFTADESPDLVFLGLNQITMNRTANPFIIGMLASGYYASGQWNPIAGGNIGNTKVYFRTSTNFSAVLQNVSTTLLTGGNTAVRPSGTTADGFLATITLFYL